MTTLTLEFTTDLNERQKAAVQMSLEALKAFLVSPNEIATEKNNALQKSCGDARKIVLNIQPKAKPEKTDATKSK
jgi:hypothetical protein